MAGAEVFKAGYVINDRFEIKRLLGQGGFAMVFEGADRNLDRQVAIKILHGAVLASSTEDHRVIERFEREAKLAASVDHPSVVNIYDAGEIEGLGEPFIVMEYLKGESLQDHLDRNGAMEASKILPLFKDVLMGLGYAHELGIVHKDLKPDNIFYRYPGTMRESLCIVDFGIAHIGRSNSGRVTRDGEFFGTPSYMPPEYISEQKVSAGFDVYQMGLILIECLTGQSVVYHEDAVATLLKHLNRQFRIPRALLESEVWPVIERALAVDPKVRYANALEFAEALHGVPISAWPARHELSAGPIRGEGTELPTVGGELGDAETEVEDDLAEVWKQEESYRTESAGNQHTASAQRIPEKVMEHKLPAPEAMVAAASSSSSMEVPISADRSSDMMYLAEQQSGKSSLGVVVAFIAVLILVAGGIVMVLLNKPSEDVAGEGEGKQIAASQVDVSEATEEQAAVTEKEEVAVEPPEETETAPTEEPPDQAPEPTPVEVMVMGEPAGAMIRGVGGEELGEAPYKVRFASSEAQPQPVVISHEGYEDLSLNISPGAAEAGVQYTLKKVARRKDKVVKKERVATVEPTPVKEPEKEKVATTNPVKIELPGQKKSGEGAGSTKTTSSATQGIILPK